MAKFVLPLARIDQEDTNGFGEKIVQLAIPTKIGVNTPDSFAVNFEGFEATFLKLKSEISKFFSSPNPVRTTQLVDIYNLLSQNSQLPEQLSDDLKAATTSWKGLVKISAFVYVDKSLAEFEKTILKPRSWNESLLDSYLQFLNTEILKKVSDFSQIKVSLLITAKTEAEVSGLVISSYPNKNQVTVRAQWGEYNSFVSSDEIKVSRNDISEFIYSPLKQEKQFIYKNNDLISISVASNFQKVKKLSLENIKELLNIVKKLENNFLTSVELYYEINHGKLLITNVSVGQKPPTATDLKERISIALPLINKLTPAVPGIAFGMARSIKKTMDLKKIRHGDIAVVPEITKYNLKFLKKASAIVSRKIVSSAVIQNIGIPTLGGNSANLDNQVITVDGKNGAIYKGAFAPQKHTIIARDALPPTAFEVKTATKIFATLDHPSELSDIPSGFFSGIAPFKPEQLLLSLKLHPEKLTSKSASPKVVSILQDKLAKICELASGNPVIYRLSDLHSHQLISTLGGQEHEIKDSNPLLGLRGAKRHLQRPEFLNLELSAIKEVRNKSGFKNLWVALPFVRTKEEFLELNKLISTNGLSRSPSFKVLLEIDLAANIFELEEFISLGIDGVLIDFLDLLNFTLGSNLTLTELNEISTDAIRQPILRTLTLTKKHKLFSCIYNFPLKEKKLLREMIGEGIKAISVHPDELAQSKIIVAAAEKSLVTHH